MYSKAKVRAGVEGLLQYEKYFVSHELFTGRGRSICQCSLVLMKEKKSLCLEHLFPKYCKHFQMTIICTVEGKIGRKKEVDGDFLVMKFYPYIVT